MNTNKSENARPIQNTIKVGIFGSDGDHCTKKAWKIAYEVGKLLAKSGLTVFTGGGTGVMEAASQGAKDNNGFVIGILPGSNASEGNEYVDIAIPTGIGFARGQILTNTVDAAILIEGGLGTREEAGLMYWLQKPTIAITSSGGTAAEIAGKSLDKRNLPRIVPAKDAKDAVNIVLRKFGLIKTHPLEGYRSRV